MLLRLSQLKSLTLILLILLQGCSFKKKEVPAAIELLTFFPNDFFSVNKNHALLDQQAKPQTHLFYDTTPDYSKGYVNVIITTPDNHPHNYTLDLNSGQKFYSHSFCTQGDTWNRRDGTYNRPTFSIGYIPRVIDQLAMPQKILVFSKRKNFAETYELNYQRVKIIGGYVEQICPDGNCIGKSNWVSHFILIGVDVEDQILSKIETAEEFQKHYKWEETSAVIENIDGRNSMGDKTFPAIKVGQFIDSKMAREYFEKRGATFFSQAKISKITKSCHVLYDRLITDIYTARPEDQPATTQAELKAKVKLRAELKKKKLPIGFAARFTKFTEKYLDEMHTCDKFIYHGNINNNPEHFWFLNYMSIYYRLHKEGYYYDCQNKAWQKNTIDVYGNYTHDLKKDISSCSAKDIDQAMMYLPNFLTGLKSSSNDYFRFIEYDNHIYGSHRKMYSWVKVKARKFDCRQDINEQFRKEQDIFPEEVIWQNREVRDIENDLKIIY